mmetsp:Transcript_114417/g.363662  ORF Transcript_114417/g.363662 Transcript_114417/m.363662 type:complete len:500 (-) Transcript_114417:123-1622(-)
MSTIVCAISGQPPEEPCFSPKTGHVYEKRLILKNIESSGKCPVTKEELTQDDLVDMKANKAVRPRPAAATSIPGMLQLLQSEWDALMTETYELKTNLDTTRKQLSHALYQHDAACRVVARLLRERDASRAQVQQLQEQLANSRPLPAGVSAAGDDSVEIGLTPDILQRMTECSKALSKTRKKRDFPDLAPVSDVKRLSCVGSHPTHQSTAPGILCIDVHKTDDTRIVTGGVDTQVIIFDAKKEKMAAKMVGHTKKVTTVVMHPTREVVLSASADNTARVWANTTGDWAGAYTCATVVRKHTAEVTDVSLHPLGDFFSTCSRDKSWALHDLTQGRVVRHVTDLAGGYTSLRFHPDGLILAGGCEDKTVNVWDIKEQKIVATLSGHEGEVDTLSFSENGYYLATGSRDGAVKIWDLRKPLNIQTLNVDGPVNSVRFDSTGQYLAVAANTLQVFNFETKSSLGLTCELKDHQGPVMGAVLGQNARTLASVSMDRTLKLFHIK